MKAEGSLLRKAIYGLTGVGTRGIREGLSGLDNTILSQIEFVIKVIYGQKVKVEL